MQEVLQQLQLRFPGKLALHFTNSSYAAETPLREGNKSGLQVHWLHCSP